MYSACILDYKTLAAMTGTARITTSALVRALHDKIPIGLLVPEGELQRWSMADPSFTADYGLFEAAGEDVPALCSALGVQIEDVAIFVGRQESAATIFNLESILPKDLPR